MIELNETYAQWLGKGEAVLQVTDSRQVLLVYNLICAESPSAWMEDKFDKDTKKAQFMFFMADSNEIKLSEKNYFYEADVEDLVQLEPWEVFRHPYDDFDNRNIYTAKEYNEAFHVVQEYRENANISIPNTIKNINTKKENDTMNSNKFFSGFDFGKVNDDEVRASMYGLAVKDKSGKWVSFDPKNHQVIDVDAFNFKAEGFAFKMPVALSAVAVNDLIYHNGNLMFVTEVNKTCLKAVDINCGEVKEIIPTRNMFNFNFVTKVVSLLSCFSGSASPDFPFGNLLPLMLMDDENSDDMMLPLMLMMNQQGGNQMQNMMLPLMLMGKSGSDKMLPLMLMMNGGQFPGLTPTASTEIENCEN